MTIYCFYIDVWTLEALPDTQEKCEEYVGRLFCKKYTDPKEFEKDYNSERGTSFIPSFIRIFV